MNHTNPLEKQLESWGPRRPSAVLKGRIFASAQAAAVPRPVIDPAHFAMPGWMKLAPVCCIVLAVMLLNMGHRERSAYLAVAGGSNVLAGLSSNLLAMGASDPVGQRENVWSAVTFDWTNDGCSLSTTGSFPSGNTNIHKL